MWVPESTQIKGMYACSGSNQGATCTLDRNRAIRFETEQKCKIWCDQAGMNTEDQDKDSTWSIPLFTPSLLRVI